jgi:hypothetical protein
MYEPQDEITALPFVELLANDKFKVAVFMQPDAFNDV